MRAGIAEAKLPPIGFLQIEKRQAVIHQAMVVEALDEFCDADYHRIAPLNPVPTKMSSTINAIARNKKITISGNFIDPPDIPRTQHHLLTDNVKSAGNICLRRTSGNGAYESPSASV